MTAVETELARTALIAGEWRPLTQARPVASPYDGQPIGLIGWAGPDEARAAVDAAAAAMEAPLPAYERAAILDRLSARVAESAEELARTLALEAGKPIRSARTEVDRAVQTLTLSAGEARRLAGEVVPMDATPAGAGRLGLTLRVPVGVVAAITPFNFPLNLACHKLGPALAAGCAVVLKPADKAPFAACRLAELALECGLPPGWLNVLVGDAEAIAGVFCADPRVGLITFTGSSSIGWELRARAPKKRVTLELGNVTPVIVDETADPEQIASALARSAFGFSGQSCISTQRIYVHDSVASALEHDLADAAGALVTGDPLDEATDVGPLISAGAADRVGEWIDEAVDGGAVLLTGGGRHRQVVTPAVLANAPAGSRLLEREAFGPVVTIQRYGDFADALRMCNATDYGLQAGIFTGRLDRALAAARELKFGGVVVNDVPSFRADQMPYGGIKASGNTKEGPAWTVREMTEERLVVLQT
jgi:acyl-CoA reductase-like NAD-dependent aldehyde dehydrogenase